MKNSSFNNVTISRSALTANYLFLRTKAESCANMLAMIKADAYGHGAVEVAKTLAGAGCTCFGVGEVREAVLLREAGIVGEIFVMLGFAEDAASLLFEYSITPIVYKFSDVELLAKEGQKRKEEIGCHIKIDTGMGRLGFAPDDAMDVARAIDGLPGVFVAGLVSHFPEADTPHAASTQRAIECFSKVCVNLKSEFSATCHLANSAGMLNFPEALFDMSRAGISLYGYNPAGSSAALEDVNRSLTPVMSFSSRILQLKNVEAGVGISYGHIFTTSQNSTLAVIPVGYEDGYPRSLSNKSEVLIRGCRAPIRGRICMNMCMVDVSAIEGVTAGDEVVFLGKQGNEEITADDIADWADTISYEILCMLGHANNKVYVD